jgi:hypothetical protein
MKFIRQMMSLKMALTPHFESRSFNNSKMAGAETSEVVQGNP